MDVDNDDDDDGKSLKVVVMNLTLYKVQQGIYLLLLEKVLTLCLGLIFQLHVYVNWTMHEQKHVIY